MQSSDRPEFEALLAALCAAFNVPMTEARIDGFWRGLSKMTLAQFSRVIDQAVGEDGAEKFPSVSQVWTIHRSMRAKAQPVAQPTEANPWRWDRWDAGANVALIGCAQRHGHRDSGTAWQLARRIAAQFRALAVDGDPEATYPRMRDRIATEYRKLAPGSAHA